MNKYSDLSEEQFRKTLSSKFYNTTAKEIGSKKPILQNQSKYDVKSKFTDHLYGSGMYKNASLNTTKQKQRWVQGSKDWMQHLG